MNKIIMMMSVSVDGFFEGPEHEIGWHLVDDELHAHFNDWLAETAVFLEGRVTYELMAGFWPTADADPDASRTIVDFARIWRDTPKVVYSRTLASAEGNATIVREIVPADVLALKAKADGDLVVGGADVDATFLRHDLIDEIRLYVHPVVLGRGRPLFQGSDAPIALRLAETRAFGNGVVLLRYARPAADHG